MHGPRRFQLFFASLWCCWKCSSGPWLEDLDEHAVAGLPALWAFYTIPIPFQNPLEPLLAGPEPSPTTLFRPRWPIWHAWWAEKKGFLRTCNWRLWWTRCCWLVPVGSSFFWKLPRAQALHGSTRFQLFFGAVEGWIILWFQQVRALLGSCHGIKPCTGQGGSSFSLLLESVHQDLELKTSMNTLLLAGLPALWAFYTIPIPFQNPLEPLLAGREPSPTSLAHLACMVGRKKVFIRAFNWGPWWTRCCWLVPAGSSFFWKLPRRYKLHVSSRFQLFFAVKHPIIPAGSRFFCGVARGFQLFFAVKHPMVPAGSSFFGVLPRAQALHSSRRFQLFFGVADRVKHPMAPAGSAFFGCCRRVKHRKVAAGCVGPKSARLSFSWSWKHQRHFPNQILALLRNAFP